MKTRSANAKGGQNMLFRMAQLILAIAMVLGVGGGSIACSRNVKTITGQWPAQPVESKMVLSPGDNVEVKFRFNPELNETQVVRPDGKISLQLLDEVEAAGLSPQELDQKLTQLYEKSLVKPELTVFVRSMNGQRVYVGGEVKKTGVILMPGKLTALEAVMEAGGFDMTTAKPSSVVVVRHADGKRYARLVDLGTPLKAAVSEPLYLAANDIVYVPRTKITKVDQWVDQYINKLIPEIARDVLLVYAIQNNSNGNNGN